MVNLSQILVSLPDREVKEVIEQECNMTILIKLDLTKIYQKVLCFSNNLPAAIRTCDLKITKRDRIQNRLCLMIETLSTRMTPGPTYEKNKNQKFKTASWIVLISNTIDV